MKTAFRIVESAADDSVNLGYVEAPVLTSKNSIVTYDFSGNHVDNVSSFPAATRLLTSSYDKSKSSWYLRTLYASDAIITNRILSKRGIKRAVPLFYQYTTEEPLISQGSSYDGAKIINRIHLLSEYNLITSAGITLGKDSFLHDVEFIPYNVYLNIDFNPILSNLFFIRIYSNGTPNNTTLKIKYRALDRSLQGGKDTVGREEYLSFELAYDLFNINFDFKDGMGSDLIGFSYPDSRLNPLYGMNPKNSIPVDPDFDHGRKDDQYSLLYYYADRSYLGILSDSSKKDAAFQNKPAPLFIIYYNGVLEDVDPNALVSINAGILNNINASIAPTVNDDSDDGYSIGSRWLDNTTDMKYVLVDATLGAAVWETDTSGQPITQDNGITLILKEPGTNPRTFSFNLKGKASYDVAYEITSSSAPFTAFECVRIESISLTNLFIETTDSFTPDTTPTQVFNLTSDNGIIIRSRHFISKYTQEPTLQALPPVDKSSRLPWNPRVKLGGYVDEDDKVFFLNEYSTQQWSTRYGYPYIDVTGEKANFVKATVIKTSYRRLYNDRNSIVLFDSTGDVLNSYIDGIDALNGLVYLKRRIKADEIFITYSYKERFFEVPGINLNPTKPHNAEVGKFYVLYVRPFFADGNVNSSTIGVEIAEEMPTSNYIGNNLILSVFLITDQFDAERDYKISTSANYGGGVRKNIKRSDIEKKVPDINSLFDYGLMDGLRFPANSVVHLSLPTFLEGNGSIVTQLYDPNSVNNTELKVYGACKIPHNTIITIWYSGVLGSPESILVKGPIDHNTVKLASPLTNVVHIGARITFPVNIDPLFTIEEIRNCVRKFSTAGSHHIMEFK